MAAETVLDLDFSEWEGNIPHKTNVKKDNTEVITFHSQRADGKSENYIAENGPYGKYLKSAVTSATSNVAYIFPGQQFGGRTAEYTLISYVIRNTNTNNVRSNLRPMSDNKKNSGFYEWENNKLKLVSNGSYAKTIDMDPEQYYHFEFLVDCIKGEWDFYLDGVLEAEDMKLHTAMDWTQGFFYLTVQNYGTDALAGEVHLDEMKVVFLDGEGIETVPHFGKYADGKLVSEYSDEDLTRSQDFFVVNHGNEEESIISINTLYEPVNGFNLLKSFSINKLTLPAGINRIKIDSPLVPAEGEKAEAYFKKDLFGGKIYGSFSLEGVKEAEDE